MMLNFIEAVADRTKSVDELRGLLKQDLRKISENAELSAKTCEFAEAIVPCVKGLKGSGPDALSDDDLLSDDTLDSNIRSLLPLAKFQKAALIARNYVDAGQWRNRIWLAETLESQADERPDLEALVSEFGQGEDCASVHDVVEKYRSDFDFHVDQAEMREYNARLGKTSIEYAAGVIDIYGGLPNASSHMMAMWLDTEMQEIENSQHVVDEKLVPLYDSSEKQERIEAIYAGFGTLFEPSHGQPLTQDAIMGLLGVMGDIGHEEEFQQYAQDHGIKLVTPEAEFRTLVARNERIDKGLEVPEWVEERQEQQAAERYEQAMADACGDFEFA